MVDRLPGRKVHEVNRPSDFGREGEIAGAHDALAERRPRAETELGGDLAAVRVSAMGECRLLAVNGNRAARDGAVLQRAPHHSGGDDRPSVVSEPDGARVGELAHLGQLHAVLLFGDRGEEANRDLGFALGALAQAAEHVGLVDDGVGVRHRQDRAVPACCCGRSTGRDRLLVFAPGGAEMNVRVDERGCQQEAGAVDDAVPVRVDAGSELRDRPAVDPDVEDAVDVLARVENPGATDDEVVGAGPAGELSSGSHHATSMVLSSGMETGMDSTGTGPLTKRS